MDRYPYYKYTILLGATRALAHIGVHFTRHVFGLSSFWRRCWGSNPGHPRDRREYLPLYYNDIDENYIGNHKRIITSLQRKDQDIVNAMILVKVCKQQFQMMRDNGWSSLLDKVSYFCERHNIDIPSMNDTFLTRGRPRRKAHEITNLHHYQVELFYVVIDMQLQEQKLLRLA